MLIGYSNGKDLVRFSINVALKIKKKEKEMNHCVSSNVLY